MLTVDGSGEYDTTIVWNADETGWERHKTFQNPRYHALLSEFGTSPAFPCC